MRLRHLQRNWNALGEADPFWAVLTRPDKKGGRWTVGELLEDGRREIDLVMADLDGAGLLPRRHLALDFGCGVGRLTQALARHFDHVVGVDIASSMIERAWAINRMGARCDFMVNEGPDLRLLPSGAFDLIYSNIVLQHVAPSYARRYMADFVRLLSDEGVAVFHLPEPVRWQRLKERAPELILRPLRRGAGRRGPVMQMYGMAADDVETVVRANGGTVVSEEPSLEGGERYPGLRYVVRRAPG